MVPKTCPKSHNKHWWLSSWKNIMHLHPPNTNIVHLKMMVSKFGISSSRRFHFQVPAISFPGVQKNTDVRKKHTPSCNASSIIPLWLRFFSPVVFPTALLFFGSFFSQQFVEIWFFILQVVKTPTGDLFQWMDVSGSRGNLSGNNTSTAAPSEQKWWVGTRPKILDWLVRCLEKKHSPKMVALPAIYHGKIWKNKKKNTIRKNTIQEKSGKMIFFWVMMTLVLTPRISMDFYRFLGFHGESPNPKIQQSPIFSDWIPRNLDTCLCNGSTALVGLKPWSGMPNKLGWFSAHL